MTCVVIALKADLHADAVVDHLANRTEICRIDPIEDDFDVHFDLNHSNTILLNNKALEYEKITGVYCRFALDSFDESIFADPIEKYSFHESISTLSGILLKINEVSWINYPWAESKASGKIFPLVVAKTLGLNIPRFFATNNLTKLRKELSEESSYIIKPISDASIAQQNNKYISTPEYGEFKAPFTTDFNLAAIDDDHIDSTPFLVQEKINKIAEIRVVVVDQNIFSTRSIINPNDPVDRRLRELQIEEPYELDKIIKLNLIKLTQYLGLRFSTFDLLEDEDSSLFLVDINPSGNWLWQELATNINVSATVADALIQKVSI